MARASAVKMPPEASAVHGCEGARRVLALMLAFSADKNTLTARQLADATGIALPTVYRGPYEYSAPERADDHWPQNEPPSGAAPTRAHG